MVNEKMTQQQIGDVLGVHHDTVRRDLNAANAAKSEKHLSKVDEELAEQAEERRQRIVATRFFGQLITYPSHRIRLPTDGKPKEQGFFRVGYMTKTSSHVFAPSRGRVRRSTINRRLLFRANRKRNWKPSALHWAWVLPGHPGA
jgi:hypothetical protein